jgi:fatty-acyl-CoA synthase
VRYILGHSGARYLQVDSELEALVAGLELAAVTVIRHQDTGSPADPYVRFLAAASPQRPESWLEDEEKTISINYTSGELIQAVMSTDSVYLWRLPMFHCNGCCFPWR